MVSDFDAFFLAAARGPMKMIRWSSRVAALTCVAIGIALLFRSYPTKSRPSESAISAAEDQVYEAILADMIGPVPGQTGLKQLVFGDSVLTELKDREDTNACKARVKQSQLQAEKPVFNSLADKMYRLFVHGWYDRSPGSEAARDFSEKSCTPGRLSRTFHADLPRSFVNPESVYFGDWDVEKKGSVPFRERFPGAGGIISFSHVGFDSALNEAIVSTGVVCGGLCGAGHRYVLKKRWGKWEVTDKRMIWVS